MGQALIADMLDGARAGSDDLDEWADGIMAALPTKFTKRVGVLKGLRAVLGAVDEAHATQRATLFAVAELVVSVSAMTRVVAAAALLPHAADDAGRDALVEIIATTAGIPVAADDDEQEG